MVSGTPPPVSVLIRKAVKGEAGSFKSAFGVLYCCLGGADLGLEWFGSSRGVVGAGRYSFGVMEEPL